MISSLLPQQLKNQFHLVVAWCAWLYYGRPAKRLSIIGVTGTDGKTTTSTIIYHVLKTAGFKVALISTVAAYIDKQQIDTGFHVTSPDPWQLQRLLRVIADKGIDYVVIEATSHGLDQHRFFGVGFDIGVLTNITHEHLDYHRTYQRYVQAKAKLFSGTKVAIINKRDQSHKYISRLIKPETETISYDINRVDKSVAMAIEKRFPQKYNQANAVAAWHVALCLGVTDQIFARAISTFPGVTGRMEEIQNNRGFKTIVDFAHTPNALKEALTSLRPLTKGKLIAVYGSAGLRDREKRKMMGQIGSQLADEVILTAEDPRTESVWSIINEMMTSVTHNHGHMHKIPDRQEAINFAVSLAKKGDTVVVLGKGHEKSMCFGTIEHPWSDHQAIKTALSKL